MSWGEYVQCTCGWYTTALHGYFDRRFCPKCGEDLRNNWAFVAREVSAAVWYKPWTWLTKRLEA